MTLPLSLGDDMRTGKVYRFERDFRGDPKGGPIVRPENYVGDVDGIIYGSAAPQRLDGRQERASTEGMIGCTGVPLRNGDRIIVNDEVKFSVVGRPQWDYPNIFTGTDSGVQWVAVESIS